MKYIYFFKHYYKVNLVLILEYEYDYNFVSLLKYSFIDDMKLTNHSFDQKVIFVSLFLIPLFT